MGLVDLSFVIGQIGSLGLVLPYSIENRFRKSFQPSVEKHKNPR